jgi:hypothetical protein
VLGDKGAGKSSTLAWLAGAGHDVLTDDILLVEGGTAYAGPRCIDLREEPAERLGLGEDLGVVGARRRFRHLLPPCPPTAPLRGWILPRWGDDLGIRAVPAAARVPLVVGGLALRVAPVDAAAFLDLATLPVLELHRPQRWDSLEPAADLLVRRLGELGEPG